VNVLGWKGFWFFCALFVGTGWTWLALSALRPIVAARPQLAADRRRFAVGVGLALALPAVLLGVFQVAGNLPSVDYLYSGDRQNLWVTAGRVVALAWYAIVVWWIWSRHADAVFLKFGEALPTWLRDQQRARLALTSLAIVCVGFFIVKIAS
jgi:hypothetical protein